MVCVDRVLHKHTNMLNLLAKRYINYSLSFSILKASTSLIGDSEHFFPGLKYPDCKHSIYSCYLLA